MGTKRYKRTKRNKTKRNKPTKRNTRKQIPKKRGGDDKIYVTEYDDTSYIKTYDSCQLLLAKYKKTLDASYLEDTLQKNISIHNLEQRRLNIGEIKKVRLEFINELLNGITIPDISREDMASIELLNGITIPDISREHMASNKILPSRRMDL